MNTNTSGDSRESGSGQDRELLVRVAWYYYRDNLTHAEIAERLHVSRPTVTRLLERARQTGVVTIEINTRGVGGLELAERLRERFGLADVIVVPQHGRSRSGEATNSRVARAASQYLRRYLIPGAVIAVGYGDTVLRTLLATPRQAFTGVTLATLTGGIDSYTTRVSGAENAGLSEYIRFMPSPFLASSPEVAAALRRERSVLSVLDMARAADAAIVGIGAAVPNATILTDGVATEHQLYEYQLQGAIGDILGDWYNVDGEPVAVDLQKLRIGLPIRELRSMKNVIGVAGGSDKTPAIRAALVGRYLDVLVTTEDVAHELAYD